MTRKTKEDWGREIIQVRNQTLWGMYIVAMLMFCLGQCSGYDQGYRAGQKSAQQNTDSVKTEVKKAELPKYLQKQIMRYQTQNQR